MVLTNKKGCDNMVLDEQIINKIDRYVEVSPSVNKIENSNYILAMLLKDIRDGKVVDILDVTEWCFDKINTARNIEYLMKKENMS
jgi:hypothetical protein